MSQEQQQALLNYQIAAQNGNRASAPQAQLSAAQYRILQQQMLAAAASGGEPNGDDPGVGGSQDAPGYYFAHMPTNGQPSGRSDSPPGGDNRLG